MTTPRQNPGRPVRPLVWYVAAGYPLPGGIEAHILHYATELRRHGFDTRVVVFKELPAEKHRFWKALEERGIRLDSAYARGRASARLMAGALFLPWLVRTRLRGGARPPVSAFRLWVTRRAGMRAFRRLMRRERPDLLHVFGRLPTEAWRELPISRTIFHEMMTGTVDSHWTPAELASFRSFAGRVARYFAPGEGVAANVRREFGVTREIVPIYTMCPDETESGVRSQGSGVSTASGPRPPDPGPRPPLRFGILCRLTGQKGVRYLLDALKQYRDRHGDVDFTFAGIGPMEGEIRGFVDSNELKHVTIVRVDSAVEVLRKMDVFVHPSVNDAMPVSIAEALMCGVPCIVSRVGGCDDLVRDGVEGFVIEPRRADLILERMERFAAMTEEERQAFGRRARARYEEVCRPEEIGKVVAAHYEAMLGKRRTGPDE